MRVFKGHGTENDFVVLPDLDGRLTLTPEFVQALCDRHGGIGADGVLRVVRSENDPEAKEMALQAPFFMDYRNADGSVAEMCGNGIRVVMRYLQGSGLVDLDAAVATRGGIKRVQAVGGDGDVTVDMGRPLVLADRPVVTAAHDAPHQAAATVLMPNPHVVVWIDAGPQALGSLDLGLAPDVQPARPDGQNVEFVVRLGSRHLSMRVFERGVGETRSCGTGICAVAVAAASADGVGADGVPWRVDVPGGTCTVTWRPDDSVLLSGPAVLVAEIELMQAWLSPFALA
ncbi:MAG TPA: diaminopimelate epimerase [Jatrophihabitantaceae bacterium]|nr:diaminopimelate epimerase [Jatrophihabitantaceae bacterium]